MFDPRPLYCSSLTTAVGGTKDTNIFVSVSPYHGTNQLLVIFHKLVLVTQVKDIELQCHVSECELHDSISAIDYRIGSGQK